MLVTQVVMAVDRGDGRCLAGKVGRQPGGIGLATQIFGDGEAINHGFAPEAVRRSCSFGALRAGLAGKFHFVKFINVLYPPHESLR